MGYDLFFYKKYKIIILLFMHASGSTNLISGLLFYQYYIFIIMNLHFILNIFIIYIFPIFQ